MSLDPPRKKSRTAVASADKPVLGAVPLGDGRCRFRVWAPLAETVHVHLLPPRERLSRLAPAAGGYHDGVLEDVDPGALYLYRLDARRERPDPASRFQPDGVHGPSQVMDTGFDWTDAAWRGIPLRRYIFYELHVGTFTPEGTFDGVSDQLDDLAALGITAVELMPIAQFPGNRNWGYDGVYPFAVQGSYGGPVGLKRLIDTCHQKQLAVVLDVVYNHLGPEGNYLAEFGPYFSDAYRTPWGAPLNFDGPHSDEVRRFFIENALYWITEFHIDALRLDAVHAILDFSARPFLEELTQMVHLKSADLGRPVFLIAESALNDTRLIRPPELGGMGIDAQWNDDLHHALHAVVTGEHQGYYGDFGKFEQLLKALREGFVYSGEYSEFRKRRHGNSSRNIPAHRLVVFAQNHDQVGNRKRGDRLTLLLSDDGLRMMAGVILLSPYLPLLFMGEEYGETAPFPFFISHSDPDLIEAVRKGRRAEWSSDDEQNEAPDPQDEKTFTSARLNHALRHAQGPHHMLWEFYRRLTELRTRIRVLAEPEKARMEVIGLSKQRIGCIHRWSPAEEAFVIFHADDKAVSAAIPLPAGRWSKELDSRDTRWGGTGSSIPCSLESSGEFQMELLPYSFLLLLKNRT
ncbi:MAG: malto-oligosyltrehalose trehalohydrolase [Deltaproteobacteria bacterium]|nr:malto-oligosyltrehalose trehalohydrolase [Deltaproteobacteria bacterium]